MTFAQVNTLCAAQQFPNYNAAQQVGAKEGYIVFIYPAGWDKYGEKLCKKLIADEQVRKAAGNAALLLVPVYQNSTNETNAETKQILGPLGTPGNMADISYPAIAFYEKEGRMYATLHGERLMSTDTPAGVAKNIREILTAKQKQDAILKKAHAATDVGEKNRLFVESSRVPGMGWPGGLRETMQAADPGDTHGYLAALNFGFGLKQGESMDALFKRLDDVLANDRLDAGQKQRACAIVIGHVRRSMGPLAGGPYITKYAKAMHKLDPDSTLGLSAPIVMRDWVREYHYGQGWAPEVIPGNETPILMQSVPIKKAGTYTVSFHITTGCHPLFIKKVRLLDANLRCVSEDATESSVTYKEPTKTYTVKTKKPLKNAVLEITLGNKGDQKSTWGEITVSPQ